MEITVELFAAAREAARCKTITVKVPGEATASRVLDALNAHPDLGAVASRSRLAVNQVFATPDAPVRAGDEVALIPPVGGG
jgi:molybdopterin synthase catalytic subunit